MNRIAYALNEAALRGPEGDLVSSLGWLVRDCATTALLGPVGTGKSLILRALSGTPLPQGWRRDGVWTRRGLPFHESPLGLQGVAYVPQVPGARRSSAPEPDSDPRAEWRGAFLKGASVILLDEAEAGLSETERAELVDALKAHARQGGAAVIVTHDLSFARAAADDVALLCAGAIVTHLDAETFFEAPPNDLAARFVRDGNCWPKAPEAKPLPGHFHWVVPGLLAGMGRPGLAGPIEDDMEALAQAGVGLIVTLTEAPLPQAALPQGVASRHFPIVDMGVPAIGATATLCRQIEKAMAVRTPVVVHCHGGMGRTGTILASVLAWKGEDPDDAIRRIREVHPGYIQNRAQGDFVRRFAEAVNPRCRSTVQ